MRKIHHKRRIVFDSISLILAAAIFLPGDLFFTEILNPVKTHSSVIKGPGFPYLIGTLMLTLIIVLLTTGRSHFRHAENGLMKSPVIWGFIIFLANGVFDGIFAAVLSLTRPQMWIGPTALAIGMARFTVQFAKKRHDEAEGYRKEKEEIFRNLISDKLTGLYTRDFIQESLKQKSLQLLIDGESCALLFVDLDNFKSVNDHFGHAGGDKVLKIFGDCALENIRKSDIAARYGGDEFLIQLNDCSAEEAVKIGRKIQSGFASKIDEALGKWSGIKHISLSIGVVSSEDWEEEPEETILKADCAMYASKKSGKNRTTLYDTDLEMREYIK